MGSIANPARKFKEASFGGAFGKDPGRERRPGGAQKKGVRQTVVRARSGWERVQFGGTNDKLNFLIG